MVIALFIESERETEGEVTNLTKRLRNFTSLLAGGVLSSLSSTPTHFFSPPHGSRLSAELAVGSESMVALCLQQSQSDERKLHQGLCESHGETQHSESQRRETSPHRSGYRHHQQPTQAEPARRPKGRRIGEINYLEGVCVLD
jgi:hypothetical protein